MTNLVTNAIQQIDPSNAKGTADYIATLFYNFALHFGLLPFFLLLLAGVVIAIAGVIIWNKFFRSSNSSLSVKDIEMIVSTAQQPTIEKISQILENIRSHLRTDEVVIILRIAESYLAFEVVDICRDLQSQSGLTNDQMKEMFDTQVEMCITLLDKELLKLPDIATAVVPTEEKIRTMKLKTDDFINIVNTQTRPEALKKSCENLIKMIGAQNWYR